MKLITLNTWGGKVSQPFFEFLRKNKEEVDIFCFQEIFKSDRSVLTPKGSRTNLISEIAEVLSDFDYFFSPNYHGRDFEIVVDYPLSQGLAIFWKKHINFKEKGQIFTRFKENVVKFFKDGHPDVARSFQYLIFDNFVILNIHGYWEPAPKYDTPERFEQSQKILDFIKKYDLPKIICGDFNSAINNKNLEMLEKSGLNNLVKESGAQTTRSSYYDIKWRKDDKFADYIFVSKDVNVKHFEVMSNEVSDHLPLYLEFEI